MNKIIVFVLVLFICFSICCVSEKTVQKNTISQSQNNVNKTSLTTSNPYFIGDGGKGISLGIGVPKSQGLNTNQTYLPTLVQGVLVDSFKKYSSISVLDRVSLDRVIAETLDPTFEDNLDIVRLGHVAQVKNWLTGNIIKTSTGYTLQINITDTTSNANTVASYTENCTVAEFDDHSAIHRASLILLEQMGIVLTQKAKNELEQASTPQYINAQTALSQGIVAQQKGTFVEALTYYYEAENFDRTLLEATIRGSMLSTGIQSGNLGENVRNDIQRRNAWLKVLQEATVFYKNHSPFEILYNPVLTWGNIDYNKETVDISFEAGLFTSVGFMVICDIKQGLLNTGRSEDWGFKNWPDSGEAAFFSRATTNYSIKAVLINEDGKIIGNADGEFSVKNGLNFINDMKTLVFRNVDANKISDNTKISIFSVNGIDAKIASERGYIKVTIGDEISFSKYFSFSSPSFNVTEIRRNIYYNGNIGSQLIIPSKIGQRPVTSIGTNAFSNINITSVIIPNTVTSIEARAFQRNKLIDVIIPDSVTTIGSGAFQSNQLINVTLGKNIKTIGYDAFSYNKLTSVIIPDSVTSIGFNAFEVNEISNVIIGKSVTFIGKNAFSWYKIKSITIPANVKIDDDLSSGFVLFYYNNEKRAGTYLASNYSWSIK